MTVLVIGILPLLLLCGGFEGGGMIQFSLILIILLGLKFLGLELNLRKLIMLFQVYVLLAIWILLTQQDWWDRLLLMMVG